jgi:DNA-binding transcriptional LysR family regulator
MMSLQGLCGESFVDFEPAHGTRKLVDRAFAEAGLERRIAFELSDLNTLLDLVARGLGIVLVPQAIAFARRNSIAHVALKDAEICWEPVVAYTGDTPSKNVRDAAPAAFLKLLVQRFVYFQSAAMPTKSSIHVKQALELNETVH